uniref:ADP-ribose pyrophosphatase, mitochondrial (Trinotate prediction) n=1 Tax=Myxobolus squamalis TaxID=59785 RepID=A0A6B2FYI7_MYXSQ
MPRLKTYPRSDVSLFYVPKSKSSWMEEFVEYNPPYYTSNRVLNHPSWSDSESTEGIKFNQIDGNINRTSFMGIYDVINGIPRNPKCRTGIKGRGLLGKWGPNHAVDILISRLNSRRRVEFLCIIRKDTGKGAFPGGMVDNGETKVQAMIREAAEEVLNLKNSDELSRGISWLERNIPKGIDVFFYVLIISSFLDMLKTEETPTMHG